MKPFLSIACVILLAAGLCAAQTPSTQPAAATPAAAVGPSGQATTRPAASATTQPASAAGKVTVVSVTGQAQRCDSSVKPLKWEPLKVGDVLSDLTLIRTGLDSGAVLNLDGRGEVSIASATKIGITEFRKEGPLTKTALGLKYGSIQAEVDSKKGPANFQVSTPTATLSVRGSQPQISFGSDIGTHGYSLEGILQHLSQGHSQSVNPGEGSSDNNHPPIMLVLWRFWSQDGDTFGLTHTEIQNLVLNGDGRGVFSHAGPTGSSSGGSGITGPAVIPPSAPHNPFLFP